MICSGCHDDYDTVPCIPAFASSALKKPRKGESLSEALTGAAVAFAKAVSGSTPEKAIAQGVHQESSASTPGTSNAMSGVSPGKAVDLKMKSYEQLRYLQQLYEDGILDQKEFIEQKKGYYFSQKIINVNVMYM